MPKEKIHKSQTKEYSIWTSMKSRCNHKGHSAYKSHGAIGIKVCDRWINSFDNFLNDMGRIPGERYLLIRLDTSGDFNPENCKWVQKEESKKRIYKNQITVKFKGKKYTIRELSDKYGIEYKTLSYRLRKGYPLERALNPKKITQAELKNINYRIK